MLSERNFPALARIIKGDTIQQMVDEILQKTDSLEIRQFVERSIKRQIEQEIRQAEVEKLMENQQLQKG